MKWLIGFAAGYPRRVLIALLVITLSAALMLPKLDVHISAEALTVEGGAARDTYEESVRTFGATDTVILLIHDAELFQPQNLDAIRSVVDALSELAFVEGVDSLFTLKRGRLAADNTLEFAPYLDPLPATGDAAVKIRDEALANAFVERNLLSDDGHTMAVNIRLRNGYEARYTDGIVVEQIEAIIAPLRAAIDEVFALGQPQLNLSISDHIVGDQMIILPLSLAALLLVLSLSLGRWEGVLLPILTATASVVWTLGFMVMLGISLNVMTSVVPLLLVVVGSTEDVHLLSAYFSRIREGARPRAAIDAMAAHTGLAVLLTFATTYLGFLAITLNDVRLMREFGLVASTGLLFNFVITTLLVPAMLSWLESGAPREAWVNSDFYRQAARWLHRVTSRHRLWIAAISSTLLVIAVVQAAGLRVNNNVMEYLPADSPIIGQSERLHQDLAGIQTFDIVLTSGIEGTFERIRYLRDVEKVQRFLDASGRFDKTLSFVDVVKEVNRVIGGLPPGQLFLPSDDNVVREFLLFLDAGYRRAYVNDDMSRTRISVRHNIASSHELKQAVAEIEDFVSTNIDPGLHVYVTGASILAQRAGDALAMGQAESLLLIVAAIFLIVTALFLNIKAGLLAVVPNILPIAILFGVMGLADIPLSTGTAMVAAISIGICVDDTIHFLIRYHQEIEIQPAADLAIRAVMEEEALPIFSTTMALTLGFGVLALSSFQPVVHFGLLAALVFLLALAATFVVTPILLGYVRLVTVWDVLGVRMRARLMKDCVLFRGMRTLQVRKLIAMSRRQQFDVGELIVHQGDAPHELFVILDGRVRAQRTGPAGEEVILNTMGIGDVFGEIALTAEAARTADVVTLEKTEVLTLHWRDLQALARYMPRTSSRLLLNIASAMGQRLISREF